MGQSETPGDWAVVTLADERYFPGVVALWASVATREGQQRPAFGVVNVGLTDEQIRALRSVGAHVLEPRGKTAASPVYSKPAFRQLLYRYDVVCYCDADVVVLGDLTPWVELAASGTLVAYPDGLEPRSFDAWSNLVAGRPSPRPHPYVNAGFLVVSRAHWALLERWEVVCDAISEAETVKEAWVEEGPWMFGDQDALNAVLRLARESTELCVLPQHPPPVMTEESANRLRVETEPVPYVRWDDHELVAWHWAGPANPWETRPGTFDRCEASNVWQWFLDRARQHGLAA